MANYTLYGNSKSMFDAIAPGGAVLSDALLYVSPDEFGIRNADGSNTYFKGTDFAWDASTGAFTAGFVTSIEHYANGRFIDSMSGFDPLFFAADILNFGLSGAFLKSYLFRGNDVLTAYNRAGGAVLPATLAGGEGDDTITGGAGADKLNGDTGNDIIQGDAGNDRIDAGFDNDYARGGLGNDTILGSLGDDTLRGSDGDDVFSGGDGTDAVNGGSGLDTYVVDTAFRFAAITKTAAGFSITVDGQTDTLAAVERIGADDGTFLYNATTGAWNKVSATSGAERLDRAAVVTGTSGDDLLNGKDGTLASVIKGLAGNDTISLAQLAFGGDGNDTINANRVYGDAGDDLLTVGSQGFGGSGNDTLQGGFGTGNTLDGGTGNDLIQGRGGTLAGGSGADTFEFSFSNFRDPRSGQITSSIPWGKNVITDFVVGTDHLNFVYDATAQGQSPVQSLTLTADGWLVSHNLDPATRSQILLKGVTTAGLTIDDLIA